MQYNGCDAEGIVQLSTASWDSVEHLDLSRSCLYATDFAALAKGSWFDLSQLHLSGNLAGHSGSDTACSRTLA